MDAQTKSLANSYDEKYRRRHFFKYREWLYRPFVKSLLERAHVEKGCSVLDVGCGQGFCSWLFADFGLKPVGVDISAEAIRSANGEYGLSGARFEVGDVRSLACEGNYDCVFARGLSLYNSKEFVRNRDITDALLAYLKPGGVMIFDYYTNLCPRKKSDSWIYHPLSDVKKHFSAYPGAEVYFSLRIETLLLGSWAFRLPFSWVSGLFSRCTGIGGDVVAFVPRPSLIRDVGSYRTQDSNA